MTSREAFEARFPMPGAVTWTGEAYAVREGWEASYPGDRYVGQWAAWQAAIQHACDVAVKACEAIEAEEFRQYKGRPPEETLVPGKAYNPYTEGLSDGAGLCAEAIKEALK